MRLALRQFYTLAGLTALEAVRQPIVILLTAASLCFIALMPILFTHTLDDSARLVRDSALALHFVMGLILGVLTACTALRAELRSGTAAAVLSKPVPRALFFLGKYAGLAAVTLAFSALMAGATLLATRTAHIPFFYDWWGSGPLLVAVAIALALGGLQNYRFDRPFASRTFGALLLLLPLAIAVSGFWDDHGHFAAWGAQLPLDLLPASALIALAILLLTGFALALATRLDTVPALVVSSVIFLLGLMADYFFGRGATHSRAIAVLDGIVPNFQHFWAVDALAGDGIPWTYVARVAAYTACYLLALLTAGIIAFRHMELR
ncbi:MAG: ABC transporter permease [Verrucomicrobia bacterium]|nr:ABC transporter permease [Verrucomicrobiota bacterium]